MRLFATATNSVICNLEGETAKSVCRNHANLFSFEKKNYVGRSELCGCGVLLGRSEVLLLLCLLLFIPYFPTFKRNPKTKID